TKQQYKKFRNSGRLLTQNNNGPELNNKDFFFQSIEHQNKELNGKISKKKKTSHNFFGVEKQKKKNLITQQKEEERKLAGLSSSMLQLEHKVDNLVKQTKISSPRIDDSTAEVVDIKTLKATVAEQQQTLKTLQKSVDSLVQKSILDTNSIGKKGSSSPTDSDGRKDASKDVNFKDIEERFEKNFQEAVSRFCAVSQFLLLLYQSFQTN
ncbi:hypothetical protein RFI_19525, partial [Reticulomyxa filosa]